MNRFPRTKELMTKLTQELDEARYALRDFERIYGTPRPDYEMPMGMDATHKKLTEMVELAKQRYLKETA